MRRRGRRGPWAFLVAAGVAAVLGCGGGDKPPPEPQTPDGFETSWTGFLGKTYEGDQDTSLAAARAALRRLGLSVVEESGSMFRRSFDVEAEDGTFAVVEVAALTKTTTRVSVKVGYFLGDRDAARRIHSEIDAELAGRRGETKKKQGAWEEPGAAAWPGATTTTAPARRVPP